MYRIEIHQRINQATSFMCFMGFWGDPKRSAVHKCCLKTCNMAVVIYYLIVVLVGSIVNDNDTETIFLVFLTLTTFVHAVRIFYFIRQEKTILTLVRSMGTHSINDRETFTKINNKIKKFIKFAFVYYFSVLIGTVAIIFSTIMSNGKRLPLNVYSPFDWKNNEFAYVIAVTSTVSVILIISLQVILCATCIWYLMMCCGIEYQILKNEFRNMGKTTSVVKERDFFLKELIVLIEKHQALQK